MFAGLLEDVGRPAGVAGQRERRREEVGAEADALEDRRGVELDVRLEGPVRVALGEEAEGDVLDLDRELEPVGLVSMPSATLRRAAARGS